MSFDGRGIFRRTTTVRATPRSSPPLTQTTKPLEETNGQSAKPNKPAPIKQKEQKEQKEQKVTALIPITDAGRLLPMVATGNAENPVTMAQPPAVEDNKQTSNEQSKEENQDFVPAQ